MRKCLAEEFSDLYIFHLRGDVRKDMLSKGAAHEGQNIFDAGSMTGIAISILVKHQGHTRPGNIHFHDIGPDLTTNEKKNIIRRLGSIDGISKAVGWTSIEPDKRNDWLNQVDDSFDTFTLIGSRSPVKEPVLFEAFSNGVSTQRDAWVYNASVKKLHENVSRTMKAFNAEVARGVSLKKVDRDPKRIKWSADLEKAFERKAVLSLKSDLTVRACFRPFEKTNLYYDKSVVERSGSFHSIPEGTPIICLSGNGARAGFSALCVNVIPNYDMVEKSKCFPLYVYEETKPNDGLFAADNSDSSFTRRDAITDDALAHFQAVYPGQEISKEDLFYYTYGILHSPDYRERYKNNLAKQLPESRRLRPSKTSPRSATQAARWAICM